MPKTVITSAARGFSLLGVLVATGMVVVVVVALVGTVQRAIRAERVSAERTIATFLAREGIELVRSIRDDNWLKTPRCAVSGPCVIYWRGPTAGAGTYGEAPLCNGTFRVDASTSPPVLVPGVAESEDTRLYRSGIAASHDAAGTKTPFRRWVTIYSTDNPGCGTPSTYTPGGGAQQPPAPVTVTAVVMWEGKPARSVTLAETLYPWMNMR